DWLWLRCLFLPVSGIAILCFFFQAEDCIRADLVTGVQTCALPICLRSSTLSSPTAQASRWSATTPRRSTPFGPPPWRTFSASRKIGRASCRERVWSREKRRALAKRAGQASERRPQRVHRSQRQRAH